MVKAHSMSLKISVELEGDIRYMTVETQQLIEKEVHRIIKGIEDRVWG